MEKKFRCPWCLGFEEYIRYHDEEWGVPVHDDRVHFEFLVLEGAQAGLSWTMILKKRPGYRKNFAEFDPQKVARFSQARIEKDHDVRWLEFKNHFGRHLASRAFVSQPSSHLALLIWIDAPTYLRRCLSPESSANSQLGSMSTRHGHGVSSDG